MLPYSKSPDGRSVAREGVSPATGLIAELLRPAAYPHPVERIELLETHISWVLLTGEYAYKVKKPVALPFLDFRELERRRFFCDEEIRLNRAWAPELYVDVVPITRERGRARVGGHGTPVEYAVRMRQFDQALRLDHQLEAGRLGREDMVELAEEIAARHREAEPAGPPRRLLLSTKKLMWENFEDLIGEVGNGHIPTLHRWTKETLDRLAPILKARCTRGFYRECHGDLHLGNIVRLPDGIRAFDCIEFSDELRRIDVVADYGFLVMDLAARGRTDLAYAFLNRYLEVTGDHEGVTLLPLYVVYRSLVRAKVAAIRRRERPAGENRDDDTETITHCCELARTWSTRQRPALILMTGYSGSGKTWLSTRLLSALPALRLRSDLERKRLFGLEETADSHSGIASGIYDSAAGKAVYGRMFESARSMLEAGFDVILDAAFLDAGSREQGRRLAADCGAHFLVVEAAAPLAVLEKRLGQRAAAGNDASEAGVDVLRYQLDHAEPLRKDERLCAETVDTASDVDVAALADRLRRRARRH